MTLYRVPTSSTNMLAGSDSWTSPFDAEIEESEIPRRALRIRTFRFDKYTSTAPDLSGTIARDHRGDRKRCRRFYDQSLGNITTGCSRQTVRFTGASNEGPRIQRERSGAVLVYQSECGIRQSTARISDSSDLQRRTADVHESLPAAYWYWMSVTRYRSSYEIFCVTALRRQAIRQRFSNLVFRSGCRLRHMLTS